MIFFLGDGMGISTLTAARILKGQQQELLGPERALLSFEAFPNVCLARTYCLDSTVADSACSATAYLGGVKTNIGTLGVAGGVKYKNCEGQALPQNQVGPTVVDVATQSRCPPYWRGLKKAALQQVWSQRIGSQGQVLLQHIGETFHSEASASESNSSTLKLKISLKRGTFMKCSLTAKPPLSLRGSA